MIVDCSGFCGAYSRNGGEPICWEGYAVSEDHKVDTQRLTVKRMAWFAALHIQDFAKTILPWKGASRTMDRRPRERCIPDASRIPRGNSPGDRRPVEMAKKAWIS